MTPQHTPTPDDSRRPSAGTPLDRKGALDLLAEGEIDLLRLQYSDLSGALRHVDVPARRFQEALDGAVRIDGASAGGFARLEETDLLLRPDPATLGVLPWSVGTRRVARAICDVHRTDGSPFEGDPRGVLRRAIRGLEETGLRATVASEIEFFLLPSGGLAPAAGEAPGSAPGGEAVRQEVADAVEAMGFEVVAGLPEAAPGQHELDLGAADPLRAADALATLKVVARAVAERYGLRASFMPKPLYGRYGSGLHFLHTLFRDGSNAFSDPESMDGLSDTLRSYVGGLLLHARGFAAITNPLVNSYKRLVPGFAAPLYATWSLYDSSPLVRIPPAREERTGCEVRLPDPAGNPYLALAVQLAAGVDGVLREVEPASPIGKGQGVMGDRELQRRKIASMPRHLGEALQALEEDRVVRSALGEYVFSHFVEAKRAEWEEYVAQVHAWEVERYLGV